MALFLQAVNLKVLTLEGCLGRIVMANSFAPIVTVPAISVADLLYMGLHTLRCYGRCLAIKARCSPRPQPAPTSKSNTLPLTLKKI